MDKYDVEPREAISMCDKRTQHLPQKLTEAESAGEGSRGSAAQWSNCRNEMLRLPGGHRVPNKLLHGPRCLQLPLPLWIKGKIAR